ncbi:hydroxymethylglutaryl-CoA reductase [candidate division KSB1 bacterium]|nr:hydroxymethylglutaryl-CoA reductase [candidate division KSB1 bacterium]
MKVPSLLLKRLYTFGSLQNDSGGVRFSIKNRLSDAEFTGVTSLRINDMDIPEGAVKIDINNGEKFDLIDISEKKPISFPLRTILNFYVQIEPLETGKHNIEIGFGAKPFGNDLALKIKDSISESTEHIVRLPRNAEDDYTQEIIEKRQHFVEEFSGASFNHLKKFSFDAHETAGNCEHFTGVAQVPIGFAGPITINGEHAIGDFIIPLATTEGTLVASYNRGMKVLNLSGGVTCTVVEDAMQRAPVFTFENARQGREFIGWVKANMEQIRGEAEATSSVAKLEQIHCYQANKFVFLRFNYTTGDAAGQNMVGRATYAACSWIHDRYPNIQHFYLESNFATDKKASQINIMRTRGKRVTAEVTIPRDVLIQHMRVQPENLTHHGLVANIGAFLSGANNNGLHSANAITAMFIATGQDVANVAESSAGVIYTEIVENGDLYISITLPSLIVATHGGGTGLPTQRECLEILGCTGRGKVKKLAEIIAGVVLAGEISLASAISSLDWVSSHEQYGRNR